MKLPSVALVFLSLLLVHTHFSLAKRGGGFGRGTGFKKSPTSNRGNTHTNTGRKPSQAGSYPKQPGSNPQQPGGYPQQPGRAGYPNQQPAGGYPAGGYPARGYPAGGGYPARGYPAGGGYPAHGSPYGGGYGYGGGHGGYAGGYMNHNPNNQILSPRYGGSYGYGGYGGGGGSPFSHRVQSMGMAPSMQSRGFGRTAVMAAGGGMMVGMALGYGLGRFPRPPFNFHNPQEEYYYNHYMYQKYGTKSTDANDYSRDYKFSPTPVTYDSYMSSCMKRTDLFTAGNQQEKNPPTTTTTTTTTATVVPSAPDNGTSSNTSESNSTAADKPSTPAPSTPHPLNLPKAHSLPPASVKIDSGEEGDDDDDDDDDTVSIVEIGYPALIEQMKARRCVELFMVYSEKHLQRQTALIAGVRGLGMGSRELLAVLIGTILMLLNSNMLLLLH